MSIVTLSNGRTVEVYPVPPFALTNVEARYPGVTPEAVTLRERMIRETAWLLALPDVSIPEGWQCPRALQHAGIEPRQGETGRILDYIEYGLLLTADDIRAVQVAMYGGALTEDEIGAAEATFRLDRGHTTTTADPF
ncbi:MAG TPA: hypothetical protein PKZ84_10135 [Anaerolineae bacterium]|nr:hypothetical protein [Anaerolineae bacterium]HQI85007.1 hypothetical protein [Anaerolineae bacterium]